MGPVANISLDAANPPSQQPLLSNARGNHTARNEHHTDVERGPDPRGTDGEPSTHTPSVTSNPDANLGREVTSHDEGSNPVVTDTTPAPMHPSDLASQGFPPEGQTLLVETTPVRANPTTHNSETFVVDDVQSRDAVMNELHTRMRTYSPHYRDWNHEERLAFLDKALESDPAFSAQFHRFFGRDDRNLVQFALDPSTPNRPASSEPSTRSKASASASANPAPVALTHAPVGNPAHAAASAISPSGMPGNFPPPRGDSASASDGRTDSSGLGQGRVTGLPGVHDINQDDNVESQGDEAKLAPRRVARPPSGNQQSFPREDSYWISHNAGGPPSHHGVMHERANAPLLATSPQGATQGHANSQPPAAARNSHDPGARSRLKSSPHDGGESNGFRTSRNGGHTGDLVDPPGLPALDHTGFDPDLDSILNSTPTATGTVPVHIQELDRVSDLSKKFGDRSLLGLSPIDDQLTLSIINQYGGFDEQDRSQLSEHMQYANRQERHVLGGAVQALIQSSATPTHVTAQRLIRYAVSQCAKANRYISNAFDLENESFKGLDVHICARSQEEASTAIAAFNSLRSRSRPGDVTFFPDGSTRVNSTGLSLNSPVGTELSATIKSKIDKAAKPAISADKLSRVIFEQLVSTDSNKKFVGPRQYSIALVRTLTDAIDRSTDQLDTPLSAWIQLNCTFRHYMKISNAGRSNSSSNSYSTWKGSNIGSTVSDSPRSDPETVTILAPPITQELYEKLNPRDGSFDDDDEIMAKAQADAILLPVTEHARESAYAYTLSQGFLARGFMLFAEEYEKASANSVYYSTAASMKQHLKSIYDSYLSGERQLILSCIDPDDVSHMIAGDVHPVGRLMFSVYFSIVGVDLKATRAASFSLLRMSIDQTLKLPESQHVADLLVVCQQTQSLIAKHAGLNPDSILSNHWFYQSCTESFLHGQLALTGSTRSDWQDLRSFLDDAENSLKVAIPGDKPDSLCVLSPLELAYYRQCQELQDQGKPLPPGVPTTLAYIREHHPQALEPLQTLATKALALQRQQVGVMDSKKAPAGTSPKVPDFSRMATGKSQSVSAVAYSASTDSPASRDPGAPAKMEATGPFSSRYSNADRAASRDKWIRASPTDLAKRVSSTSHRDKYGFSFFFRNKDGSIRLSDVGAPHIDLEKWRKACQSNDKPVLNDDMTPNMWYFLTRCRYLSPGFAGKKKKFVNLALERDSDPFFDENDLISAADRATLAREHASTTKAARHANLAQDTTANSNKNRKLKGSTAPPTPADYDSRAKAIFERELAAKKDKDEVETRVKSLRKEHNDAAKPGEIVLDVDQEINLSGDGSP